MNRRVFLKAVAVAPLIVRGRALGANNRIRAALIGSGGRGKDLARFIKTLPDVEMVAACDVFEPRVLEAAQIMGSQAETIKDYRRVLDRKDIDAVIIATPDHWHTTMTLEAVAAGKDVYCEKPVTHDLTEGDKLIAGVERSGRIVATGTQQRSWDHYILAKQIIDSGRLGQITFVRTWWFQDYVRTSKLSPIDQSKLDWEQWRGPAPKQPFELTRFRRWRLFWDFGGGVLTDLMVHWIDVVQWFLDSPSLKSVRASGVTHAVKGVETPDTVSVTMEFPQNYTAIYYGSMVGTIEDGGIIFRGTNGMMELTREGFKFFREGTVDKETREAPAEIAVRKTGDGTVTNLANWLDCIRSRKTPNANVRAGVASARTGHLANKAMRENRIIEV